MKWISVKKSLPIKSGRYLVFEKKGEHSHNLLAWQWPYPCCESNIAYYDAYFKAWNWSSEENEILNPTHWMPLPNEPKE